MTSNHLQKRLKWSSHLSSMASSNGKDIPWSIWPASKTFSSSNLSKDMNFHMYNSVSHPSFELPQRQASARTEMAESQSVPETFINFNRNKSKFMVGQDDVFWNVNIEKSQDENKMKNHRIRDPAMTRTTKIVTTSPILTMEPISEKDMDNNNLVMKLISNESNRPGNIEMSSQICPNERKRIEKSSILPELTILLTKELDEFSMEILNAHYPNIYNRLMTLMPFRLYYLLQHPISSVADIQKIPYFTRKTHLEPLSRITLLAGSSLKGGKLVHLMDTTDLLISDLVEWIHDPLAITRTLKDPDLRQASYIHIRNMELLKELLGSQCKDDLGFFKAITAGLFHYETYDSISFRRIRAGRAKRNGRSRILRLFKETPRAFHTKSRPEYIFSSISEFALLRYLVLEGIGKSRSSRNLSGLTGSQQKGPGRSQMNARRWDLPNYDSEIKHQMCQKATNVQDLLTPHQMASEYRLTKPWILCRDHEGDYGEWITPSSASMYSTSIGSNPHRCPCSYQQIDL